MHMPLRSGKVPPESLTNVVFKYLGVPSKKLLLGPGIGEDAAIVDMGKKVLVVTTDPITWATENVGWLSVHINANDVASRGARPRWYLCSILLHERSNRTVLRGIMRQIDKAARELDVTVAGGHTEVTPGLDRPIVIGFMIGETPRKRFVTSGGAKPGDAIILTKGAGLEGTAILATELLNRLRETVNQGTLNRARQFIRKISIVQEAMTAVNVGCVHALHDPTEGGLITGLWELAEASKTGFRVEEKKVIVPPETRAVCEALAIDPLRVMSSGALLIACSNSSSRRMLSALEKERIPASQIGKIVLRREGRILTRRDGASLHVAPPLSDDLYKILGKEKSLR